MSLLTLRLKNSSMEIAYLTMQMTLVLKFMQTELGDLKEKSFKIP